MMRILIISALTMTLSFINGEVPALAQEENMRVGEVRVIDTTFEIRSLLNGASNVVSLNADSPKTLILIGLTPGRSNVVALGGKGARSEFSVTVRADQRDLIHIHKGPNQTVATRCDPRCDVGKTISQKSEANSVSPN
jgi:Flp pilus assembly secretin CpaC